LEEFARGIILIILTCSSGGKEGRGEEVKGFGSSLLWYHPAKRRGEGGKAEGLYTHMLSQEVDIRLILEIYQCHHFTV